VPIVLLSNKIATKSHYQREHLRVVVAAVSAAGKVSFSIVAANVAA
jgi:hypothetical protein